MQNQNQPTQQLDPTIVNMARAIKSVETQGQSDPYTARGASGEYGAYQYTPGTWSMDAKKYLGQDVPLEGASIAQQNEVAYNKIKDLKAQGMTPIQVASYWNSGNANAYADPSYKGVNKKGMAFDVPQYATSVAKAYEQFKSGQTPSPQTTASTVGGGQTDGGTQDGSLGSELQGRLQDVGKAAGLASQGISDISQGNVLGGAGHIVSGAIQGAGALAGGVNDVVTKGLELIPGVKWLEGKMGQGVQKLAQTPVGSAVVGQMQQFAKDNPELADDIGAGFNIATAIPIFKGLGLAKDVAMSGAGRFLEGVGKKAAFNDLVETFGRTKTLGNAFANNGGENTLRAGIEAKILPDIQNGYYTTENAWNQTGHAISDIENTKLQPLLSKVAQRQSFGQDIGTLEKKAIEAVQNDPVIQEAGAIPQAIAQVQKRFAGWRVSYGDSVKLDVENKMKRGAASYVNWNTPEGDTDNIIRSMFQKDIEQVAAKNGFTDVASINKQMGDLIKYQKLMKALDKTPVKMGVARRVARKVAGAAIGTGIGKLTGGGLPAELAGGLIGEQTSNLFAKKNVGGIMGRLLTK